MGLGFRDRATLASFEGVYAQAGSPAIAKLAVLRTKAQHAGLRAFIQKYHLPLYAISADALIGIKTRTCTPKIFARYHTGSVSEALALVVAETTIGEGIEAGGTAHLLGPRLISEDRFVTLALAKISPTR